MGRLVVEIGETENQQFVRQTIDMLLGRTKTTVSVLRSADNDVIKALSVHAPNFTDQELNGLWNAINPSIHKGPMLLFQMILRFANFPTTFRASRH